MILIIDDDSAVRSSLSFMRNVQDMKRKLFPDRAKQWMWCVPRHLPSF